MHALCHIILAGIMFLLPQYAGANSNGVQYDIAKIVHYMEAERWNTPWMLLENRLLVEHTRGELSFTVKSGGCAYWHHSERVDNTAYEWTHVFDADGALKVTYGRRCRPSAGNWGVIAEVPKDEMLPIPVETTLKWVHETLPKPPPERWTVVTGHYIPN